jgi:hypothetical protein
MSFASEQRFQVFLSHNTADKPAVEHLAQMLVDKGVLPWFDKWNLIPGAPWQQALEDALAICPVCAVFIGPSGFGLWQTEEMNAAIDRRVSQSNGSFRVIPVLLPGARREERSKLPSFLRATTWVEFSDSLDDENAFHLLLCGIRGEEPGSGPGAQTIQGRPYRGLEYFDLEHSGFFFGRESLIGWLLNALKTPPGGSENRFLGLVGPVGSGKSSLARAGLLAAIRRGELASSASWPIAICRPGMDPVENLAIALAQAGLAEKTPSAIRAQIQEFRASERTLHLASRLVLSDSSPLRRVAVLVDQFEEAFTQRRDDVIRFSSINNLMTAAADPAGQTIVSDGVRSPTSGGTDAGRGASKKH